MPSPSPVPEPSGQFLRDLDAMLAEEVRLSCLGGFAITLQYGLARQTADIDVLEIAPSHQFPVVLAAAGAGSSLHTQHGLYIQHVAVMTLPEDAGQRRVELFPNHPPEPETLWTRPLRSRALQDRTQ